MGILNLAKIIADMAPEAIKQNELKSYFGRKVAIDASMSLYQFLIAVRSEGMQLTTASGETTSHLNGTFYRTIKFMEYGIKPVYVFDGKPPDLKSGELNKRAERREETQKALQKAEEDGDVEQIEKFNRRLVKVSKTHTQECKDLLKLMGVPFVEAPGEAEAQCAAMVNAGVVFGTATEDLDALTFGSKIMLRHFSSSEARKIPVQEITLSQALKGLNMNMDQFIDFCIILGCDYCDSIKGIGPKRAYDLIQQHSSIENILENIDKNKYIPPEDWNYKEARKLFLNPEVLPGTVDLKWSEPDEEGLVKFLCGDKNFNEERIRNGAKKLLKFRSNSTQGRLDSFFKVLPSTNGTPAKKPKIEDKKNAKKKAGAGGAKSKKK